MKAFLFLCLAMWPGTLTPGNPVEVKQAMPHIYVATRVVPRVLPDGSIAIDVKDENGAQAIVGLPTDIVDQLIALSGRKTAI